MIRKTGAMMFMMWKSMESLSLYRYNKPTIYIYGKYNTTSLILATLVALSMQRADYSVPDTTCHYAILLQNSQAQQSRC